jgi:predicted acyl esterase
MQIDWDVPIEMDDGLVLRADVFRPAGDGQYPVILSYGPYGKGLAFQEGYPEQWKRLVDAHPEVLEGSSGAYQNWEVVDPEKWVPDGYACVRVDSRGAGRSPGFLDPFSPREARDLYHCIEWAGERPWSNGKVGLVGISYYAMNQWHVAPLRPPHLAAMVVWEGAADWYRDVNRHGGILCDFLVNWFGKQVTTVQHGLGEEGPVSRVTGELVAGPETLSKEELAANRVDPRAVLRAHLLDDEHYQARSPDFSKIVTPLLSAGNWGGHGLHLRGNVEGFVRSASPQKWLEIHGGEHWTEFYTAYGTALQKRFLDHFLKGVDNGWDREPPLLLQIRTLDGFVERKEHAWPLAGTRWTRLYLDGVGMGLAWEPVGTKAEARFEASGEEGITFTTPPLEQETEISGPVALKLFVSSSTSDADLFVTLQVFDPDGQEVTFQGALDPRQPIAQGWLRVSHRRLDPELSRDHRPYHGHRQEEPLEPGQVYPVDVEVWPTSLVIPPGYRIALTVQGKDFERRGAGARMRTFVDEMRGSGPFLHTDPVDRPAERFAGTTTVHTGGEPGSYLLLPVVAPSGTGAAGSG